MSDETDRLINDLRSSDRDVRYHAIRDLVNMGAVAVKPLIEALKDSDWHVRLAAARALGEIRDAGAVEPLIQALKDEHRDVRWKVVEALGEIRDAGAVEPLTQVTKDEDPDIIRAASTALNKIQPGLGDEPSRPVALLVGYFASFMIGLIITFTILHWLVPSVYLPDAEYVPDGKCDVCGRDAPYEHKQEVSGFGSGHGIVTVRNEYCYRHALVWTWKNIVSNWRNRVFGPLPVSVVSVGTLAVGAVIFGYIASFLVVPIMVKHIDA